MNVCVSSPQLQKRPYLQLRIVFSFLCPCLCLFVSIFILGALNPQILCNGPGTCLPICVAGFCLRVSTNTMKDEEAFHALCPSVSPEAPVATRSKGGWEYDPRRISFSSSSVVHPSSQWLGTAGISCRLLCTPPICFYSIPRPLNPFTDVFYGGWSTLGKI